MKASVFGRQGGPKFVRRRQVSISLTCLMVAFAGPASAGQVVIKANREFCAVEIREGKSNQPDANTSKFSGPVSAGWSYTGQEGTFVCFRREGNPGVCPSGMKYWVCNSRSISGVDTYEID